MGEIAEALGVTEKTVAGILAIPVRERRFHDVGVLHRRGVGRVEIARLLQFQPRTITDYLRQLQNKGQIESMACPHCGR